MIFDLSPAHSGGDRLTAALRILGFETCNGCPDIYVPDFLSCILQSSMHFELLEEFEAVVGLVNYCYHQLDTQHPDAKFIYLDKDEEAWIDATMTQLMAYDLSEVADIKKMTPQIMGRLMNLGCLHTDDEDYVRYRGQTRKSAIMTHFEGRPEKLLVMEIDDGWTPLCTFLGLEVPEVDFPSE